MKPPRKHSPIEIYLLPGEIHFAGENTRIHTVLGSCVSISLWHPLKRSGGMCHFMLPSRGKAGNGALDGRYADEAVQLLLRGIERIDVLPAACQVKLFGGGNMFQAKLPEKALDIATENIAAARRLLDKAGFRIQAEDVGGRGHRRVIFDLSDGNVWVRHEETSLAHPAGKPRMRKPGR